MQGFDCNYAQLSGVQLRMPQAVVVTVVYGNTAEKFKVATADVLLPLVKATFGEGIVKDEDNMVLSAQYGDLKEVRYTWTPTVGKICSILCVIHHDFDAVPCSVSGPAARGCIGICCNFPACTGVLDLSSLQMSSYSASTSHRIM